MMASQPFLGIRVGSFLTEETIGNVNADAAYTEADDSPLLLPPQQARIPTSTQKLHI